MAYKLIWHNAHASGELPGVFTSKKAAERAGAEWKREMVAVEPTPEARRDAREEYQWELSEIPCDLRLTEAEARYAKYVLDKAARNDYFPATLNGRELSYAEPDGRSEFLELIEEEANYDAACGAKTVGSRFALKIREDF